MTCDTYKPVRLRLQRIAAIATGLKPGAAKPEQQEICFLINALRYTAAGEDGIDAFDIRAKRGERRGKPTHATLQKKATTPIVQRINRIIRIANEIEDGSKLRADDHRFLQRALKNIAAGIAPDVALETRAAAGQHKNRVAATRRIIRPFVLGWIAAAINDDPIHETPPMNLNEALVRAADLFKYSYDTLRNICARAKTKPSWVFKP